MKASKVHRGAHDIMFFANLLSIIICIISFTTCTFKICNTEAASITPRYSIRKKTIIPLSFIAHNTHNHNQLKKNQKHKLNAKAKTNIKPIDYKYWPERFPAKEHCSRCGLCETSFVTYVASSCAFLNTGMGRIDDLEEKIHGRKRLGLDSNDENDEDRFGVLSEPILLAKGVNILEHDCDSKSDNTNGINERPPQWTGVVTNIAISMLEQNLVDAVVCIASDDGNGDSPSSFAEPIPIIAKTTKELKRGRGVKPSLAPSLKVLDDIQNDDSIRKLLFCGVGCAVQAFRSVEHTLNLDEVYVLGTNCADNSPTPYAANDFLQKAMDVENIDDVMGYEFMQDYKVHVKMKTTPTITNNNNDDEAVLYKKKPYFCLPSEVATTAIAKSCLACFDYTNSLADVVVGYMGAPLNNDGNMDTSFQTLTCRNQKGKKMIETAIKEKRIFTSDSKEAKSKSTRGFISFEDLAVSTTKEDTIIQAMIPQDDGDTNESKAGMPLMIGKVIAGLLSRIGPKGLEFAKYSIDYHTLRNYLHVLYEWGPERTEKALPQYAKDIVAHYLENYSEFSELKSAVLDAKKLNHRH